MKKLKVLTLALVTSLAMVAQAEVYDLKISYNDEMVSEDEEASRSTQYLNYYFGINWVGHRRLVRFDVTNTGTTPLTFSHATISGLGFDAYHSCKGVMQPQQRCWFEISYWPQFEGIHSGTFVLSFIEKSSIVVYLTGEARRL